MGCAVLRQLAERGIEAILVEAAPDICEGASKANSAIVHTGFDAESGTHEARLLRRSSVLWPGVIDELAVPFLEVGAIMLARTSDERARLRNRYASDAAALGVETEMIDGAGLRSMAPFVSADALAALHIPGEGVIDPFWLTRAYAAAAIALGAIVWTNAAVVAIEVDPTRVQVDLADGRRLVADQAFDCAGLWADDVARSAGDDSFTLRPRKGQFLVSEHTFDVDRIVLPIPGPLGKGMLVTPIVFGGVLLGPTAEDVDDKHDRATDQDGRQRILDACATLVPSVAEMVPIRQFAGLRAVSSTGGYIIRPSSLGDRLYLVAGIRSTGVSASPAIAEEAVEDVADRRGWARRVRRGAPALSPAWADRPGAIVCLCRSVAEAEIDAALSAVPVPTTVDGVKRRCGAGFGDCQGNLCQAEVIERLAVARAKPVGSIVRGAAGSWIVMDTGDDPPTTASAVGRPPDGPTIGGDLLDLLVVGGGFAGIGTALAAADAGLAIAVLDRGAGPGGGLADIPDVATNAERAALADLRTAIARGRIRWVPAVTVSGVAPAAGGWDVDAHLASGSLSVRARRLVLATGGYVMPREHLAVDGPRPSGVMTADLALAALRRGWLPAHRVVIVGSGRLAQALEERLLLAGVEVIVRLEAGAEGDGAPGPPFPVQAVRGKGRLEAVRVRGRWLDADALILAHALRPATFLLRGLGIGDDRPGVAAPVGPDGALPLPDLWAAGTCATPDVDHADSLASGLALGARIGRLQRAVGGGSPR